MAILATLMFSCKNKEIAPNDNKSNVITITDSQFKSGAMELSSPSYQRFDVTVNASGKIDVPPSNRAQITSFIGGYVKSTNLLVGDKVVKGQVLLTLENTEFLDIQKEYLEVAEQIDYLKTEYERQKTLYNENISSQKNYLKAESEYRKAKGMYQSLKEKLKILNINPAEVEKGKLTAVISIYAPITGDIAIMNINLGKHIEPTDVMMEIVQTDHLHLELAVFEKDILKIKKEQKIKFIVPEISQEVYNAEVHLVGKSIEGDNRTINIHGHLEEGIRQKMMSGMFVEAEIIVDSEELLAIPKEAIISENNKYYILLLTAYKNQTFEFRKIAVKTGAFNENYIEILSENNLDKKSKILTKGVFDLLN